MLPHCIKKFVNKYSKHMCIFTLKASGECIQITIFSKEEKGCTNDFKDCKHKAPFCYQGVWNYKEAWLEANVTLRVKTNGYSLKANQMQKRKAVRHSQPQILLWNFLTLTPRKHPQHSSKSRYLEKMTIDIYMNPTCLLHFEGSKNVWGGESINQSTNRCPGI